MNTQVAESLFTSGTAVHFIGIGGAGMFPLAAILVQRGCIVTGSDLTESSNVNILRETLNIPIEIGEHTGKAFPKNLRPQVVIHTSAAKFDNPELELARNNNCIILRRGEALGRFAKECQRTVAVSGSHGKTTITAMISHILRKIHPASGFLVGGKVNGWKIPSNGGDGDIFVTEADESDGSHTALFPILGVIPNIEDDHAWSVGGTEQLLENFRIFGENCHEILTIASPATRSIFANHPRVSFCQKEALSIPAFFSTLSSDALREWADFQLCNAALAVLTAEKLGMPRGEAEMAVSSFPGAARRMVRHAELANAVLIEDYAHHPTELAALLGALRKLYPCWRLQVVFQPHRYARLKRYIDEFAELLRGVDQVIVTPVFAAWVETDGIDSAELAKRIGPNAVAVPENNWAAIAEQIIPSLSGGKGVVTAVVGAGDIDQLLPYLKVKY